MKTILYKGKIRDGKPGSLTKKNYEIIYDNRWHYAKLSPLPSINYSKKDYRKLVNDSVSIEDYYQAHDRQQAGYFKFIAPYIKRGETVADFGCGGGAMLDLMKGLVNNSIAIEPFKGYQKYLKEKGHKTFSTTDEVLYHYSKKIDLGLSIHVIEHTLNPLEYLNNIYKSLRQNGKLVLFTPNLDDILLKLHPAAYKPFFFRKVHNYYFTGKSLVLLGKKVGFRKVKIFYLQEYGLGNTFYWLRDNVASGNSNFEFISNMLDQIWINFLEESGQAYNVGAVFEK